MSARLLLIVLAFVANGVLSGSQQVLASQPPADFSLTLSVSQPTVKAGGPIVVQVTVRNISDHLIGVEEDRTSTQENNYRVTVLGKEGNEAATTAFHRMLRGKPSHGDPEIVINTSELLVPLDPGKTLIDPIDLARMYSLGPGTYTVRVERTFDNQAPVRSNTVTITVTP